MTVAKGAGMKVGFVVGRFPQLSETFVAHQVKATLEHGSEVTVVCEGVCALPATDLSSAGRPLADFAEDWWGPLGALRASLARLPHRLSDKIMTGLDTLALPRLRRQDVVVAHFGYNGLRVARLIKRGLMRCPLITVYHGYDVGVPYAENGLGIYKELFKHGHLHLTVNEHFRRLLIEAGAPEDRTFVHHMGVNLEEIPFLERNFSDSPFLFVSVSRLTQKKGIEFALRALAILKSERPDILWHYNIVGDGPLLTQLCELRDTLGLDEQVTFEGSQSHARVKDILATAHIFLLPSVTASNGDVEGIPVAIMEAMASGLVVVSTIHSGIPEIVQDGLTGFLTQERDPEALFSAFLRVFQNTDALNEIAKRAREKVESDFNNIKQDKKFFQYLVNSKNYFQ